MQVDHCQCVTTPQILCSELEDYLTYMSNTEFGPTHLLSYNSSPKQRQQKKHK